ncbi:hypothetical protein HER21_43580, partial [Pseudomonas sp. BGM005]|nr:hypothetical protein [Pseudomonas sp. BG5]
MNALADQFRRALESLAYTSADTGLENDAPFGNGRTSADHDGMDDERAPAKQIKDDEVVGVTFKVIDGRSEQALLHLNRLVCGFAD